MSSGLPYTFEEGFFILLSVFSLFIVVILLSYLKRVGIEKEYTKAMIKGGIQLTLIALILTFLFNYEYWYFLI